MSLLPSWINTHLGKGLMCFLAKACASLFLLCFLKPILLGLNLFPERGGEGRRGRDCLSLSVPSALMQADPLNCWSHEPRICSEPSPLSPILKKALPFLLKTQEVYFKPAHPSFQPPPPLPLDAQKLLPGHQAINQVWTETGRLSPSCFSSPSDPFPVPLRQLI